MCGQDSLRDIGLGLYFPGKCRPTHSDGRTYKPIKEWANLICTKKEKEIIANLGLF